ncbi:conserved hypothetical protein [Leishmania major strain Friedlin]|uniref:RanBP2-type domain-containing protein n=1 Tax=Leishmania major TaxID=5664 RepID=Q4Q7T7_LEIMA|nr:conserved hypothetical protein [Leishmania major strain Friedlin]CAG9578132.1 hypothetical_protein_-_conserved [Leishmania major strain Friedlin]CAJ05806.1 conserved hypothetical protein [Leishmania major strain Friedlin]|eukprot:XP_001684611.1 conserved hypothetical protein [Leishmania major strain Friedlin]
MNYLRTVVADVKLKYRASRVVAECVLKREQPEFPKLLSECVTIADGHPELILSTIRLYLEYNQPERAHGGLLLLEQLVSLCNYAFHLALARDCNIQDRIIHLAMKRGEGEAHQKAQRLARLTLLEYSRLFVDDRDLLRLSALVSSFEHRTHKSLMRCLNVQNRRVRFRDVEKSDIIPISPKECAGFTSSSAGRPVKPLQLSSAPEVWPCRVCAYLNAPSAARCAACETLRTTDMATHRSSPHTTPKMSPAYSTSVATANGTNAGRRSPVVPPLLIAVEGEMETGDFQASRSADMEDVDATSPSSDWDNTYGAHLQPCHAPPTAVCADLAHVPHITTSTAVSKSTSDTLTRTSPSMASEPGDGAGKVYYGCIEGSTAHGVAPHELEK